MWRFRSLVRFSEWMLWFAFVLGCIWVSRAEAQLVDVGAPFGRLKLVDEIDFSKPSTTRGRTFRESASGVSQLQTILGKRVRVLQNRGDQDKYFAYILGKGKGLRAGNAYVLSVEYADDQPRSMVILNRGSETPRGFYTGPTVGDQVKAYTNNNLESLNIPVSGKYRRWQTLFFLHDRSVNLLLKRDNNIRPLSPDKGFWVAIAHYRRKDAPLSKGAAVSKIQLLEVPNVRKFDLQINYPPQDLPRRRLFWREEMSDDVVNTKSINMRGTTEDKWYEYKARLMKFLGMNTYSKDLLEFGYNQGWDSGNIYEGRKWYEVTKFPKRWEKILGIAKRYGLDVLPYYEYAGARGSSEYAGGKLVKRNGLGYEKRCRPLTDKHKNYTNISWSEDACADLTDPDTWKDVKKLLYATVVRHKNKGTFAGAWFRVRVSDLPISFSDATLDRFRQEANGGTRVTRQQLQQNNQLLKTYYDWWYTKRRAFLINIRDYLRKQLNDPKQIVLFTAYSQEPGPNIPGQVVAENKALWDPFKSQGIYAQSWQNFTKQEKYLDLALRPTPRWNGYELDHSYPPPDPQRYKQTKGVYLTYPFNRAFTVNSSKAFDTFRSADGLAMVRHYPLNEDSPQDKGNLDHMLGYFVTDMERAGPYCMLGEVRAMAHGNPHYIGYLSAANFTRGFPLYVRRFNAAFLALPALPSKRLSNASSNPDVIVRSIATSRHGTYLAITNIALQPRNNISIQVPTQGTVTNLVTGKTVPVTGGKMTLSFDTLQLQSFRISASTIPDPEPKEEPPPENNENTNSPDESTTQPDETTTQPEEAISEKTTSTDAGPDATPAPDLRRENPTRDLGTPDNPPVDQGNPNEPTPPREYAPQDASQGEGGAQDWHVQGSGCACQGASTSTSWLVFVILLLGVGARRRRPEPT